MKRPWLIKAGGELLADAAARYRLLKDLAALSRRHPVVFVHGGGPQIEVELTRAGVSAHFVRGRRVTSPEAMTVVQRVLSGEINKNAAAELCLRGVKAVGLSCRDAALVTAKPIPDLGRAASPQKTDVSLLKTLLGKGFLPVVSSVGSDAKGGAVNINADDAASALGIALKVERLVFLTNVSGVLDAAKERIPVLKIKNLPRLIEDGVITGGMIPKVQSAAAAIRKGVGEVDILNGKHGVAFDRGTRILK